MYKKKKKKLDKMQDKINTTYNTTPSIVIINNMNKKQWQIKEIYYKPNKTARYNIIYLDDYKTYINNTNNNTKIIINDLV